MAVGGAYGDPITAVGGAAIIGVGLTIATLESYRGKRYRALRKGKRKWEYTVRRIQ